MKISDIMGTQTPKQSGPKAAGDAESKLDKGDFLSLLLQQLKNQDPLKPMEDREFIAQLAQFRTLEQMQQTNASLQTLVDAQHLSLAGSLIGKRVEAAADGKPVVGTIAEVRIVDKQVRLSVDGTEVELSAVRRILPPAEEPASQTLSEDSSTPLPGEDSGSSQG